MRWPLTAVSAKPFAMLGARSRPCNKFGKVFLFTAHERNLSCVTNPLHDKRDKPMRNLQRWCAGYLHWLLEVSGICCGTLVRHARLARPSLAPDSTESKRSMNHVHLLPPAPDRPHAATHLGRIGAVDDASVRLLSFRTKLTMEKKVKVLATNGYMVQGVSLLCSKSKGDFYYGRIGPEIHKSSIHVSGIAHIRTGQHRNPLGRGTKLSEFKDMRQPFATSIGRLVFSSPHFW